jgi:hypothetical protein
MTVAIAVLAGGVDIVEMGTPLLKTVRPFKLTHYLMDHRLRLGIGGSGWTGSQGYWVAC